MAIVYIQLGSNIGDRFTYLERARTEIIQSIGSIIMRGGVFESEPWGFSSEKWFLNQILKIETELLPIQLLKALKKIERNMGRFFSNSSNYQPRIIDIDILFYEKLVLVTKELYIPHKHLHNRKFVLEPLTEIAPDYIHPLFEKTVQQLLEECDDKLKVLSLESRIISSE